MTTPKTDQPTEATKTQEHSEEVPFEEMPGAEFFKPLGELNFFERGELLAAVVDLERFQSTLKALNDGEELEDGKSAADVVRGMNRVARTVVEGFVADQPAFMAWSRTQDYQGVVSLTIGYAAAAGESRSSTN